MRRLPTYEKALETLSPREKIGQLFMPAAFINDTEEEIRELEKLIRENAVGALCFFHSRASAATNFEGQKKIVYNEHGFETLQKLIKRYQGVSKYPLLIAIDAEWGLAMRIENTPQYPYAITMGALQEGGSDLVFEVGKAIAKDCKSAGIHWNLAPCIDINNNPNNPVIGYRSFGENKHNVTEKALAFVKGTQSVGTLTSIKHFPGHGDTATDSHLELPLIDKSKGELMKNEVFPFQQLIEEGVDSVMVGHLSVPSLAGNETISSSISKDIITGVLRNEMGFDGVVISDALNMHAVSKEYPVKGELEWLAFDAGNDVLCFSEHVGVGIETILKNASTRQIEESFKRIWKLKEKSFQAQVQESSSNARPKTDTTLNRKLAEKSLTLLRGNQVGILEFLHTDFIGIENTHTIDNQFFKNINLNKKFNLKKRLPLDAIEEKNVLLSLFPPQIKPSENFGMPQKEIDFINTLLSTKSVVLYLFGNPYVLNHFNIEEATAVVVCYQNFKEFQEVASEHFAGDFTAEGKLPVSIAKYTEQT